MVSPYRLRMAGRRWSERSVLEIMVLLLTLTVCASLFAMGITISIIEIVSPETDTSGAFDALGNVLSVIVGSLLGLLAGRNERSDGLHKRPDPSQDDL